jgi:hypothetical protein
MPTNEPATSEQRNVYGLEKAHKEHDKMFFLRFLNYSGFMIFIHD